MTSYRFERWRQVWRNFTSASHCVTSLLQKVTVYQRTKYLQDNSIHGRYISISVLQKKNVIWKFYFRFRLWPHHHNLHDILHKVIGPPNAEIWRHIDFSRCQPRRLNTTFGFLVVDATVFGKKIYQILSTYINLCWDITTSILYKQTYAILEFYFRFRLR